LWETLALAVAVRPVLSVANLQHFVPVVVDHLHGDLAFFWDVEGSADGRIQAGPSRFVYLGFQGLFQLLVRFVRAGKVGVADDEAAAVQSLATTVS
jgi:hypothetical protein